MVKVYNKKDIPISVSGTMIPPKKEAILSVGYDAYLRRLERLGFIGVTEIKDLTQIPYNGLPDSYISEQPTESTEKSSTRRVRKTNN